LFGRFLGTTTSSDFSYALLGVRLLPSRAGTAQDRARVKPAGSAQRTSPRAQGLRPSEHSETGGVATAGMRLSNRRVCALLTVTPASLSHTCARFRANQSYGSVLGGERMTVMTGGARQLTGLPELGIQILGRLVRVRRSARHCEPRHSGDLQQDRRLHRLGRTTSLEIGITNWPRPGRQHSAVDPARAPMRQAMSTNLKIPDSRHPRIEAADYRFRRGRRGR
jgi:hypothetical protein